MQFGRYFSRCLIIVISLLLAPGMLGIGIMDAYAEDTKSQVMELSKSAMEDYDFFELESADTKLNQAAKLISQSGEKDPSFAQVYVAQAVVSFGLFKDSAPSIADDRAFTAFLTALALDPNVEIPSDYRTDELAKILERAKKTISSGSSSVVLTVKPSIKHTPPQDNTRCVPVEIAANIPAHPDIYRTVVHYATDDKHFDIIEMHPTANEPDKFTAIIPGLATQGSAVYYYIESLDRSGTSVASDGSEFSPHVIGMTGKCAGIPADELAKQYGTPIFQFSFSIGTGIGIVSGATERCAKSPNCESSNTGEYKGVSTGISTLPFHIRANAIFNLPQNFQIGLYLRGQIVNTPESNESILHNILFGADVRYNILHNQPYRLYVGLGIGYGGANASVFLGQKYKNFVDVYAYNGPVHIAPEFGFLLTLHRNVGLAFDLALPIYFPNKPSAHLDISVGPFFQF